MSDRDVLPLLRDSALDGDLRAMLDAAANHEPSPADLAKLAQRLAPVLPGGTPPTPGSPGPAGTSLAGKVIAAVALGGAIAGGLWLLQSEPQTSSRSATADSSSPSSSSSLLAEAARAVPAAAVPADAMPADAMPADAKIMQSNGDDARHDAAPIPSGAAWAPPAPVSARPIAPPEATLLARAHEELLRGAPDAALATSAEHARAYPRGMLAQEREVIAIEALLALGRRDEARRRAMSFHATYPGSSHRERIERLVEVGPPDGSPK